MFILNWIRQWKELKREFHEPKVCESCEVLKMQVEQLRYDNDRLLSRMLEKPSEPIQKEVDTTTPINQRRIVPWNMRRQMLEAEDRKKAQLTRDAPKPVTTPQPAPATTETTVEELEEDLKVAEQARESESAAK